MWRASRVARPAPAGGADVDHSGFQPILERLSGPNALGDIDTAELDGYLKRLTEIEPDRLHRQAALAFWLNLYNAAAIRLAVEASRAGASSVLRLPGAFESRDMTVAGEKLALTDVEHGKIRRFGDPRIHGALICGSLSCPTLRRAPFTGSGLDEQLDEQMSYFLAAGGAIADRANNTIHLSRIFLWYGADFVRPHRMPSWLPAGRRRVARSLMRWMPAAIGQRVAARRPKVVFQAYDWALGCRVA